MKVSQMDLEQQSRSFFKQGRESLDSPPYLATRTCSHLRLQKEEKKKTFWWKALAICGLASSFTLSLALFVSFPKFEAVTGSPTLVEVSIQNLSSSEISFVEIRLPVGMTFHSEKYPELNSQSVVQIPKESLGGRMDLPFIVKSDESGLKKVKVLFLNPNGQIVQEKKLKIRFKKEAT